jgi:hypothetical protein
LIAGNSVRLTCAFDIRARHGTTTEPPRNRHRRATQPPCLYVHAVTLDRVCRNITTLRGLEPEATPEEIEAAARQYVRKVSGVQSTSSQTEEAFELAVDRVAAATAELLAALPPRRQPPPTLPPLRRIGERQGGKSTGRGRAAAVAAR